MRDFDQSWAKFELPVVLFIGVSTQGRRWQALLQLLRSQRTQPINGLGDRSEGIKHGLNEILIGYELESGSASVPSWAAGCFAFEPSVGAGRFRLGRAGVGKGSGCWAGLDFQSGFSPILDRN
jgi:hypothetical protein